MWRSTAISALTVVLSAGSSLAQDESVDTIKTQVLDVWRDASGRADAGRVKRTRTSFFSRDKAPLKQRVVDTSESIWSTNGNYCSYLVREFNDGTEQEVENRCEIANKHYRATLRPSKVAGQWQLSGYTPQNGTEALDPWATRLPWLIAYNNPLPHWLADKHVRIERVERVGGSTVVRLHFRLDETLKDTAPVDPTVKDGYLDLDRAAYYRPVGYRINQRTMHSRSVVTGHYQYALAEGLPVLEKVVVDTPASESEKLGFRSTREEFAYECDYGPGVNESMFWLTHFNLPEPPGVHPPKKSTRYVWLIVAAVVLMALGVYFRIRSSRPRSAPGPTS